MAVIFQAAGAAQAGAGVTSLTLPFPGTPSGQMLVAVFSVENVAPGSGPWVASSVGGGWSRTFFQNPVGANGCGLEVWNTLTWGISSFDQFNLAAAQNIVGQGFVYTGQFFDGSTSPVRVVASQAVSGSTPATPTVVAFTNELLIAVAADTLAAPGFGTPNPAGSTQRADAERSGFGTAELTLADFQVTAGGTLGPFTWPATASPGSAHGATAVMAIRPAAAAGVQPPVFDAPLPEDLQVGSEYTIRVTAIDPNTGALVSGVQIGTTVLTAESEDAGIGGGTDEPGTWQMVPGPNA